MPSDRTFGGTQDCRGCRYWSELIAKADGGGPVQALCLSDSSAHRGDYMGARDFCGSWQPGDLGAVDYGAVYEDEDGEPA